MSTLALSLKLSAVKTLSAVQRAINILKSAGPGAWYDPSDLTTLYQDSAGTTPVTAVEQPVGLMLDKSSTAAPVATIVDPSFDNAARWSPGAGWAVTGGNAVATAAASNVNMLPSGTGYTATVSGAAYKATVDITSITSGSISLIIWNGSSNVASSAIFTAPGTYQLIYTANNTQCRPYLTTNATNTTLVVASLTQVSVPGAHLIQPTATSRPTLSSRYNLLTKTEQFDDAVWTKQGVTVTANTTLSPDGTLTADSLIPANGSNAFSGVYRAEASAPTKTLVFSVKKGSKRWVCILGYNGSAACWFDLDLGVVGARGANFSASSITALSDGWYQITATFGAALLGANNTGIYCSDADGVFSCVGNGVTAGIYIWGASLTTAADATIPYQRVNTATDYDSDFSKFPPFLKFDGVDDSLYTAASVDFTSTDKMTVFAGVHKASDAAAGILVESSSAPNSTAGTFTVQAPVGAGLASFGIWSAGTTQSGAHVSNATYAAPSTRVLTGVGDISGDLVALRLNGTQAASAATDQGTGNFGNYPLYVGMRDNAYFPFNGRLYQLAIKGKAMTAAEISTLESYINSKTKAF